MVELCPDLIYRAALRLNHRDPHLLSASFHHIRTLTHSSCAAVTEEPSNTCWRTSGLPVFLCIDFFSPLPFYPLIAVIRLAPSKAECHAAGGQSLIMCECLSALNTGSSGGGGETVEKRVFWDE